MDIRQKFNLSKSIQAILYVTKKLQRKDFHKIFKILYFSDRNHLAKYSRSITGDTYIAMNDGPVPSNIYDIFKSLRGDGFFAQNAIQFSEYFNVINWNFINPLKDADLKKLSETDVEELNDSLEKYGNLTWDEVREKSHDYAWRNTPRDYPISVENMLLETGENSEYISFVNEMVALNSSRV
ncbi:MAG: SocA family protein [Bacteroidales bacterium]|nr:SocA family protein [Bacteroidales bacterium]